MPQYTVTAVSQNVRSFDSQHGQFKAYRIHLKDMSGVEHMNIELVRKADSPAPEQGATFDGDIVDNGQYGQKLKLAQRNAGGYMNSPGGREYKADPAKQRAIAMESAQKSAVEILRLAMDQGVWKAPEERSVGAMAGQVKVIAAALFEQITEVAG